MLMQQWILRARRCASSSAARVMVAIPRALDGSRRRGEDSSQGWTDTSVRALPRPGRRSASRSCSPPLRRLEHQSTIPTAPRTGPATGGRRCRATSTPTAPPPASTSRRTSPGNARPRVGSCRRRFTCVIGCWAKPRGDQDVAVDFTSALYLGLTHDSGSLRWSQLTTGVPAALRRPPEAAEPELGFAALVGCERAVGLTSTLHAVWDLFGACCPRGGALLYDDAAYPVLRWGLERASHRGLPVVGFRHHDPEALARAVRGLPPGVRPWVVTDGFCPGCAQIAPLRAYTRLAAARGGRVVVDDTQAVGLIGGGPARGQPFGIGGGGSLRHAALADPAIVLVASLAKSFGVPMAMVAGAAAFIEPFVARSETLVHSARRRSRTWWRPARRWTATPPRGLAAPAARPAGARVSSRHARLGDPDARRSLPISAPAGVEPARGAAPAAGVGRARPPGRRRAAALPPDGGHHLRHHGAPRRGPAAAGRRRAFSRPSQSRTACSAHTVLPGGLT